MIDYNYITDYELVNAMFITQWISSAIASELKKVGDITYVFCDDNYLVDLNIKHLKHNTLTDIISFDDSLGKQISGEIYISVDRVRENAINYKVSFEDEIHRVMIHGILHFCGYNDKSEKEKIQMRAKEDYYLSLREF